MKYVFRVFYLGANYYGLQRQSNKKAVENYLETAFYKSKLISSFNGHNYFVASRTDRGVNAIENLFTLELSEEPLLEVINSFLPANGSICIWGKSMVSKDFSFHSVKSKRYSYYVPHITPDACNHLHRMSSFQGEHNFHNFIKKDQKARNTICNITQFSYALKGTSCTFWLTSNRFGWEMIRRIIAFLLNPKYYLANPKHFLSNSNNRPKIKPVDGNYLTLEKINLEDELNWTENIQHFQRNKQHENLDKIIQQAIFQKKILQIFARRLRN